MNLLLTRQLALVQAKSAALDECARAFTELPDIEAHRTFKRELSIFVGEEHARGSVPTDPGAFVLEEVERIERVLERIEVIISEVLKVGQSVLNPAASPLTRETLAETKVLLEKVVVEFPPRRDRLVRELVDDDWKSVPRKVDLPPEMLEFCQIRRASSPVLNRRRVELYDFVFARGTLHEQVTQHIEAVRKACADLTGLHAQQKELLDRAHTLAESGNFQEAAKIVEGLKTIFSDLHYQHIHESIERWKKPLADLEQRYQRLKARVAEPVNLPFAQPWKIKLVREAFAEQFTQMLNTLTHVSQEMEAKPGSDFALQGRPLFKTISNALPELQAEVAKKCATARIKGVVQLALSLVIAVVLAVLLMPTLVLAGLAVTALVLAALASALNKFLLARTTVEFELEANGKIVSDQAQSQIFLNDQPILPGNHLASGTYRLTVDKGVYEPFEQHVEVRYGRRNQLGIIKVKLARESYINSLGMPFVPVPGTTVLCCVWPTRVRDYEDYLKAVKQPLPRPPFFQKPSHPCVNINYDDALSFCDWLTETERAAGRLDAKNMYRLPTDLEWSAAVGLGKEPGATPEARDSKVRGIFPWGNQWPPPRGAGNYDPAARTDDFDYTSPVGSFAPNHLGLYDLGGNVWEWCSDFYDPAQKSRVLRGASWHSGGEARLLSSFRLFNSPGHRVPSIGFRCVLEGKLPGTSTSFKKKHNEKNVAVEVSVEKKRP